jgi:hypothetical protein
MREWNYFEAGPRNGLMGLYLDAGNPAIGSDEWRALREQGQHPFADWLRAYRAQNPQPWMQQPNDNTGIVPPHMRAPLPIAGPRPQQPTSGVGGLIAPMAGAAQPAQYPMPFARRRPNILMPQ